MYSCPVDLAKWQFCAIKQIYDFQERHIQTISHIKYITQIQKPKNILSWSSRLNIWPTDWLTKPQKKAYWTKRELKSNIYSIMGLPSWRFDKRSYFLVCLDHLQVCLHAQVYQDLVLQTTWQSRKSNSFYLWHPDSVHLHPAYV